MSWFCQSVNRLRRMQNRWFHLSAIRSEQNLPKKSQANEIESLDEIPVRNMDKYLLVWSGKYKKYDDVPNRISRASIAKSHSICRIKMCNYMIVVTLIAAFFYISSAKRLARSGLSKSEIGQQRKAEFMKQFEEENQKSLNKS